MILRRLARPMLATIFIAGGIESLRNPAAHVEQAKPLLDAVGDRLPPQVPTDRETLVRIDGAVKVGAGLAFAFGKFPRFSALLLAAGLVPTTIGAHRFWDEKDPALASEQKVHFAKNLGLLGGLLIAAADTEGKPSLGWWARRASRNVSKKTHELGEWAHDTGEHVAEVPRKARKALVDALPS